jgi:hypothetical protein
MIGLSSNGRYLIRGEQSPTPPVPILDIGKYPFFQPPEEGISTYADYPANLRRPVIGLVINNNRHTFFS